MNVSYLIVLISKSLFKNNNEGYDKGEKGIAVGVISFCKNFHSSVKTLNVLMAIFIGRFSFDVKY